MDSFETNRFIDLKFDINNFTEKVLKNPVLPSTYSKLCFKVGLVVDEGDIRKKFYEQIGSSHNCINSPLLSLFDIKIYFQNALNQLVFFNPEFFSWSNNQVSINHIRGSHALLIIIDLANLTETMVNYITIIIENRDILHNENIPIFIIGCIDGENDINLVNNSLNIIKNLIPSEFQVTFTKFDLNALIIHNKFRYFEYFLFTEIFKKLYNSIIGDYDSQIDLEPRIIWNLRYTGYSPNYYLSFPDSIKKLKIETERKRCIAHGGFIAVLQKNIQCSICQSYYCNSCYNTYIISNICFGSLLSKKHEIILQDQ